ncbi:MAG: DUF1761 domain-containing protein [Patescibacteria group bacterium]
MISIIVNYWAVLIAVVVTQALGAFWYSNVAFGKVWNKDLALSEAQAKLAKKKMGPSAAIFAAVSLLSAYTLSHIIQFSMYTLGGSAMVSGLTSALWIWLGFVMPAQIGLVLFQGKSWRFFAINTSYSLLAYLIMGAIIAYWI